MGSVPEWLETYRQRALVGAYVLLFPWVFAVTTHHRGIDILLEIALGVDVLFWCLLDARIRDKPFQHAFVLPFLATWPISLAVYLGWTRGGQGLVSYAKAVVIGLGVVVAGIILGSCLSAFNGQASNP